MNVVCVLCVFWWINFLWSLLLLLGVFLFHRVPMASFLSLARITQSNTWNAWSIREIRRIKLQWNLLEKRTRKKCFHTTKITRRRHSIWLRFTRMLLREKNRALSGDEQRRLVASLITLHFGKVVCFKCSQSIIPSDFTDKPLPWFQLRTLCGVILR